MKNIMMISIDNPTWDCNWYNRYKLPEEKVDDIWDSNLLFAKEIPGHLPIGTEIYFDSTIDEGFTHRPADEKGSANFSNGAMGKVDYIVHSAGHFVYMLGPVGTVGDKTGQPGNGPTPFMGECYGCSIDGVLRKEDGSVQKELINKMKLEGWTYLEDTLGCPFELSYDEAPFVS